MIAELLPLAGIRHARERPDETAVVDGPLSWSWLELDRRAAAAASGLEGAGVARGTTVAFLGRSGAGTIAFLHGAGRVGAVAVPLGERLAVPELRAFAREAGVGLIVADRDAERVARQIGSRVLALDELLDTPPGPAIDGPSLDPAAPAVIVATSGTTGRPKAALLSHGQLSASAAAWSAVLPPPTGWLAALSFAHVAGLGIVWRAAAAGVRVVVARDRDPKALRLLLATAGISHVSLVATQLARMLDAPVDADLGVEVGIGAEAEAAARAPAALRAVLLGGGPIPASLVLRALVDGWPIVPTYGLTETGSGATALSTAEAAARPFSAGMPLPGVEVRIVRPDNHGIGEINVRGPIVFAGYVGRSKETAEVLSPDGWLRTGDLGQVDAGGFLTVADRRLDLIVSGGENIYPAEVESVLMEHPAILDAGVAGRPDPTWGAVAVAAIVVRSGSAVSDHNVLAFCRSRLAPFKVPAAIVHVAEVPRTSSGKIRRQALRERMQGGRTAAGAGPETRANHSRPRREELPPPVFLDRPGGVRLAYRRLERDLPERAAEQSLVQPRRQSPERTAAADVIVILHATLSSGAQLGSLARLLTKDATVLLLDRRGSGLSRLAEPQAVPLATHVADVLALLDREAVERPYVVGHSFGGVVALVLAATAPTRVGGVLAYEPPFLSVAPAAALGRVADVPALVTSAHRVGGAPAATEAFLRAIGGDAPRLPTGRRAALLAAGDGVLADVGTSPPPASPFGEITAPVTIVTGGASEPFYGVIVAALAKRIAGCRVVALPGLPHVAPITEPAGIARLVSDALIARTD